MMTNHSSLMRLPKNSDHSVMSIRASLRNPPSCLLPFLSILTQDEVDNPAKRSFANHPLMEYHVVSMIMDYVKPPTYQKFIHKFSTQYANVFVPVGKGKIMYLSCIFRVFVMRVFVVVSQYNVQSL
jgi:hypothetical protein